MHLACNYLNVLLFQEAGGVINWNNIFLCLFFQNGELHKPCAWCKKVPVVCFNPQIQESSSPSSRGLPSRPHSFFFIKHSLFLISLSKVPSPRCATGAEFLWSRGHSKCRMGGAHWICALPLPSKPPFPGLFLLLLRTSWGCRIPFGRKKKPRRQFG